MMDGSRGNDGPRYIYAGQLQSAAKAGTFFSIIEKARAGY